MSDTVSFILKSSTTQTIGVLKSILAKLAAHAAATSVEEAVFLSARLYPDMLPLTRQVQIACDTVARGAARLAGLDMPSFPDTETTTAELIARCDKTLAYVADVSDAAIDANERVTLQIPIGQATMPMEGRQYLSGFILPNLHFHATIAYGLMRSQGVALGKRDFLVP
ncbi:MAG: DUF1993 domain-containing protein [Hyphomonas sp.]|uniref:DUF1993 domain-containing protein n=1 Tax=Hyphomonas sp. TaxID=87 RepID=UPI0035296476